MNGDIIYSMFIVLGALIVVVSPIVNYVSTQRANKHGIGGLQKMIDTIDEKVTGKQDIRMCEVLQKSISAQLERNHEHVTKLYNAMDDVKQAVARIETKIDSNGKKPK